MGQQQLLLIVLSTVIVGIAIAVGINIVNSSAGQANRDSVMQDLVTLGERAKDWYRKPAVMGGGQGEFTGFTFDAIGWPASNENGSYVFTIPNVDQIVFTGTGVEDLDDDGTELFIEYTVEVDTTWISDEGR